METTLSTKYQLALPKATRESLHLKPGQRFLVRASAIKLVPCESLAELRGFLSGADTGMDDIRERDGRVGGDLAANRAVVAMQAGRVVALDADLAIAAARLARRHPLPTAANIISATAQAHGATIWTRDDDFVDRSGVSYCAKVKVGRDV